MSEFFFRRFSSILLMILIGWSSCRVSVLIRALWMGRLQMQLSQLTTGTFSLCIRELCRGRIAVAKPCGMSLVEKSLCLYLLKVYSASTHSRITQTVQSQWSANTPSRG